MSPTLIIVLALVIGVPVLLAILFKSLWRVPLRGSRTGTPQRLDEDRWGRLRTVVRAPDGSLWIATSNRDGRGSPRSGDDRIVSVRP